MTDPLLEAVTQLSWLVWSTEWSDRCIDQVHAIRLPHNTWVLTDGFHPASFYTEDGSWSYALTRAERFTLPQAMVMGENVAMREATEWAESRSQLDVSTFRVSATGRPDDYEAES